MSMMLYFYLCQACLTLRGKYGCQRQTISERIRQFDGWLYRNGPGFDLAVERPRTFVPTLLFCRAAVIPSAFAVWAAIRFFRGLDEMQRRIQFEGLAFSFLATCLITLAWGFLQNAGLPHADVMWVTPMLILLWGLGLQIASRRYQ